MANKNPGSNTSNHPKKAIQITPANLADAKSQLERTETNLRRTEMLLSVTQKIAGLSNLSEILWTIIKMTTV